MKVKIEDGKIYVKSEYNSVFVKKARYIQGKWVSPYWVFPEENKGEVKDLLLDAYGEADILEEGEQKVTVELDLNEYEDRAASNELRFGNILLASRQYRDGYVKIADNVMVVNGGFESSGGSHKNPTVNPMNNTILRVKNVPLSVYEQEKTGAGVRLITEIDITTLQKEKECLLARIAEIDALIKENT